MSKQRVKKFMRFTAILLISLLLPLTVNGQSDKKMIFRLNAGISLNRGPDVLASHMQDHNFDKTSPGSNFIFVTSPTDYPISKNKGFCSGFEIGKLFDGYGVGAGIAYAYHGSARGRAESVYLNQDVEMTTGHNLDIYMSSFSFELFYESRKDRAVNGALGPIINYHRFKESYSGSNALSHSFSVGLMGELVGRPFWKGMGIKVGGVLSTNARIEAFTSYNGLPWVQDIVLPEGRINLSYLYARLYYEL